MSWDLFWKVPRRDVPEGSGGEGRGSASLTSLRGEVDGLRRGGGHGVVGGGGGGGGRRRRGGEGKGGKFRGVGGNGGKRGIRGSVLAGKEGCSGGKLRWAYLGLD